MESNDSSQAKSYLIIEVEKVLEGVKSNQPLAEDDLVLSQIKDKFQVLEKGVKVVKSLDTMITRYRFEIVLYSRTSEKKIVALLKNLNEACKLKGLTGFPSVKALIIGDFSCFNGVKPEDPVVIKNREHGMLIAGYGDRLEDNVGARTALSKLLEIDDLKRKNHFIFESSASAVRSAKKEHWEVYNIKIVSLCDALDHLLQEITGNKPIHSVSQQTNQMDVSPVQPKKDAIYKPIKEVIKESGKNSEEKPPLSKKSDLPTKGNKDSEQKKPIEEQNEVAEVKQDDISQKKQSKDENHSYSDSTHKYHSNTEERKDAGLSSGGGNPNYGGGYSNYQGGRETHPKYEPDYKKFEFSKAPEVLKLFQVVTPDENFLGRESQLEQINELFHSEYKKTSLLAIIGPGGIGKTQLAAHYLAKRQDAYSAVVWLHSEDPNMIFDQMVSYLRTYHNYQSESIEQGKLVRLFFKILKDCSKRVCMIFNNAETQEDLEAYFPTYKDSDGLDLDIIITSRSKEWGSQIDKVIPLEGFDVEETKTYLNKAGVPVIQGQKLLLQGLNTELKGLPLAISQAAAYMQETKTDISSYMKTFTDIKGRIQSKIKGGHDAETRTIAVTLEISLERLRAQNSQIDSIVSFSEILWANNLAYHLQDCWAYFIRKGDLKSSIDQNKEKEFKKAIDILLSYKILSETKVIQTKMGEREDDDEEKVSLKTLWIPHQITQSVTKELLKHFGEVNQYEKSAVDWLVLQVGYKKEDEADILRVSRLIPHAIKISKSMNTIESSKRLELLNAIGKHQLMIGGNCKFALEHFQKILEAKQAEHGEKTKPTLDALISLGAAWGLVGNYEKRKEILLEALDLSIMYDEDNEKAEIQRSKIYELLGEAYGHLGDFNRQIDRLEQATAIRTNCYGEKDKRNLNLFLKLGRALSSKVPSQAKDYYLKALNISLKYYGEAHLETLRCYNILGNLCIETSEFNEAKKYFSKALEIHDRTETCCSEVVFALRGLGNVSKCLRDCESAMEQLQQAEKIASIVFRAENPDIIADMGEVLSIKGEHERAKKELLRALEMNNQLHGSEHPSSSRILTNLGEVLAESEQDNSDSAEEYLSKALTINERHFGKESVQHSRTLRVLGKLSMNKKDYSKAEKCIDQALKIQETAYGTNNLQVALTRKCLGDLYLRMGDYKKVAVELAAVSEIFQQFYGDRHIEIGKILTLLGHVLSRLGQCKEAIDKTVKGLEIRSNFLGETNICLLGDIYLCGALNHIIDQLDEAKKYLKRALKVIDDEKARKQGQDKAQKETESLDEIACRTLVILGSISLDEGNPEECKAYSLKAKEINDKNPALEPKMTCSILMMLGRSHVRLRQFEEAENILSEALQFSENVFGESVEMGSVLSLLGDNYMEQWVLPIALDCYQRAERILQMNLGDDHALTRHCNTQIIQIHQIQASM